MNFGAPNNKATQYAMSHIINMTLYENGAFLDAFISPQMHRALFISQYALRMNAVSINYHYITNTNFKI